MTFEDDFPSLKNIHVCKGMTNKYCPIENYIPMNDVKTKCLDKVRVREARNKLLSHIRIMVDDDDQMKYICKYFSNFDKDLGIEEK